MTGDLQESTRGRILRAAMELLASGGRRAVSTRAVSAAAGIQPQTIYRQFGDMDGLLAEAAREGFRRYLATKSSRPHRTDPIDDLRDGWDLHIEFGLRHPALYLLMYGDPGPSGESGAASEAATILRELVEAVARAGRLRTGIETAVAMIQSAGVGVVITLIGAPEGDRAVVGLSASVREAVLGAMITPDRAGADAPPSGDGLAGPASALRAMLPAAQARLTPGESLLLDELLTKISLPRT